MEEEAISPKFPQLGIAAAEDVKCDQLDQWRSEPLLLRTRRAVKPSIARLPSRQSLTMSRVLKASEELKNHSCYARPSGASGASGASGFILFKKSFFAFHIFQHIFWTL